MPERRDFLLCAPNRPEESTCDYVLLKDCDTFGSLLRQDGMRISQGLYSYKF
jgi:hypothetical protein